MHVECTRLTLRDFAADDWVAVHKWAVLPEACRFQAWGPNTPEETRAHVQHAIQTAQQKPRMDYTLAAVHHETGRVIGSGSLLLRNESFRSGEIAYIVHPDYWKQGLATDRHFASWLRV
jgi:RimJ/RimL family protein N-acetyltransferase